MLKSKNLPTVIRAEIGDSILQQFKHLYLRSRVADYVIFLTTLYDIIFWG